MSEVVTLVAGQVFAGKYAVEHLLRAGGMGAVYVARHSGTGRRVALKVMLPALVADPMLRARFTQEAQIASLIDSRGVVDVLDAGVDAATGMPFLVMELLRGRELSQVLRDRLASGAGPFPPSEVLDLVAQTARVLDKAHAAGVVHRDLKPENLFLVEEPGEPARIKILDFGIAKIIQGAARHTTMAGGTPLYMAPEQSRPGEITPRADLWALGLVTYHLLVGRPYWRSTTIGELYGEILAHDLEPASVRAENQGVMLPATFDAWFARCVDREPTRRFASAGEAAAQLATALSSLNQSAPVIATQPMPPADVPSFEKTEIATDPVAATDLLARGGPELSIARADPPKSPASPTLPKPPARSHPRSDGGALAGVPRWLLVVTAVAVVGIPLMIVADRQGRRSGTEAPATAIPSETPPLPAPTPPTPAEPKLEIIDLEVGTGGVATSGDRLKVHYVGTLLGGEKFDSSRDRGEPFAFKLGDGSLIKGWEQGLPGMKVGGRRKLVIPPALAYGDAGAPPKIPPKSTLVFDIELLAIE